MDQPIKKLSNTSGVELNPLFIGGCARSGTTILAKIISENFKFVVTPESQFKSQPKYFKKSGFRFELNDHKQLLKSKRFRAWEISADLTTKNRFESFDLYLDSLVSDFSKQHALGDNPWLDHTPNNIKHFRFLKEVFPQAKLIHIVRDGRAVYNSVKSLPWGPCDVYTGVKWWEEQVLQGLSLEYFYPSDVITVRYEDILKKDAKTIKKLHTFLSDNGYQFNDLVKDIIIPKYSNHQHSLVNKGINKNRIDGYKKELSEGEMEHFNFHASALLQELNYPLETPLRYQEISRLENFFLLLKRILIVHLYYRIKNFLRFN